MLSQRRGRHVKLGCNYLMIQHILLMNHTIIPRGKWKVLTEFRRCIVHVKCLHYIYAVYLNLFL